MKYIAFMEYPKHPGRQYREVTTDPITGVMVAEVNEVLDGEQVVLETDHAAVLEAATTAYVASVAVTAEVEAAPLARRLVVVSEPFTVTE